MFATNKVIARLTLKLGIDVRVVDLKNALKLECVRIQYVWTEIDDGKRMKTGKFDI